MYGADGDLPGMQPGEPVSFKLDGQSLLGATAPVWTNDYTVQRLDLAAGQNHIYLPMIAR